MSVPTDPQSLLTQAKCYLCLGISIGEALQLALLAEIANGGGSSGGGLVLGPWVEAVFPPPGSAGTPGQEIPLAWTNTTGKIQWFQCSVALSQQGGSVAICDFLVSSLMRPNYSPQTDNGDESDYFFSAILAPGDQVTTVYDQVAGNTHRVQTVWYRTLN